MKGSIDKYVVKGSSKPRWRYRIYAGKDSAGKKLYVAGAGFDKQSEASEAMRSKMAELGQPVAEAASTETFGAYLRAWLDRVDCQPKTRERYRGLADYVLRSKLADLPTVELRARLIEPFLLDLLYAPAIKREHLSMKTIHHIASVMRSARAAVSTRNPGEFQADVREGLHRPWLGLLPGARRLSRSALVSQTIVRRMRKAGIKAASLHTLRHTHASVLRSENAPVAALSARLGHADASTTERIYTHQMDGEDQLVADKWDAFISRKPQ